MLYERTIATLKKAGFSVERKIRESFRNPGETYEQGFVARLPGKARRIEGHKQEDIVTSMRVVRDGDNDDSMSDYCAGTWVDTVKRAIAYASQ